MGASFDLLHKPWIPVLMVGRGPDRAAPAAAGRVRELGLVEVLARAHRIRQIADSSPLVSVALHRLLLAVLHRVFGPLDEPSWEKLWREGRFGHERLTAYFAGVAARFDLLDARRPFGQVAGLPEHLAGPVGRLAPEMATGHRATLWDHHHDADAQPVTAAQAARWLLAHHCFCLSGCCGDGRGLRGVPAGPLAHVAVFLPGGKTLLETLLLNLVPCGPVAGPPGVAAGDAPAWERDAPPDASAPPTGIMDLLTWQPRAVLLRSGSGATGGSAVVEAIVMPGRDGVVHRLARDPMVAYWAEARRPHAWRPVRLTGADTWWSLTARVTRPSGARWRRPLVLEMLARRVTRGLLPPAAEVNVTVVGLAGARARVDLWRADSCRLPAALLADGEALADLALAWQVAERTHRVLSRHLARLQGAGDATPGSDPDALAARRAACDARGFWHGLHDATAALPGRLAGSLDDRSEALAWWARCCVRQALRSWTLETRQVAWQRSGWRRSARAQDQLAHDLWRELAAWGEA